jgi:phosphoribosylaminoimidazole-succinocarboxamide synthase
MKAVSAPELPLLHSGKVREMYEVDDRHLLMVASDRISAFDVVFAETVPDKGRVLTAMTAFWADLLQPVAATHLDAVDLAVHPDPTGSDPWLSGRALLVRRAEMLPLECIVRGYLTGSAWAEYERSGTMHGEPLPAGLTEAEALPDPVFTPSTKAPSGEHDVNIGFDEACDIVGAEVAAKARQLSLAAYATAAAHAAGRGVIIADTKFELGFVDGRLVIADELLTPDSSRFWPAESWQVGSSPPSLDKQPIRDWSAATGWDRRPPAPSLPDEVVAATRDRYVEAYERLTGRGFADVLGAPGTAA